VQACNAVSDQSDKCESEPTFSFKCEIFGEMFAFVVATEQDKLGWVAQFEDI